MLHIFFPSFITVHAFYVKKKQKKNTTGDSIQPSFFGLITYIFV